jgi:uracil phosphoribosyltransferase
MYATHRYGEDVRILSDPFLLTLLARVGSPECDTAAVPGLVRLAYERMLQEVLAQEFPQRVERVATRMTATEPRAFYEGPMLDDRTKLVICSVIRAGILPAQACYEVACRVLPPENVRLDFLNMSREADEDGQVVGVRMDGSKIGGSIEDAVVLIPDPMSATGGTVARVLQVYEAMASGRPSRFVSMHLMATPESIVRLTEQFCGENAGDAPGPLRIYTGRLDRGLSPPDVLATEPGTHADRERGLNDVQYIVPGAGGMGELLTNSWV